MSTSRDPGYWDRDHYTSSTAAAEASAEAKDMGAYRDDQELLVQEARAEIREELAREEKERRARGWRR